MKAHKMQVGGININKTFVRETARYILFGLSGSGVSYGCYFLLTRPLDIEFLPATMMASFIANTYGFLMNNKFVFVSSSSNTQRKEIAVQYLEYLSSRLLSCLIEALILNYFIDTLGMYDILVKTISGVIFGILNYLFTKLVVFEEQNERFNERMKSVEIRFAKIGSSMRNHWSTRYL